MKRYKVVFVLFLYLIFAGFTDHHNVGDKVYVCMGKSSKRYHYNQKCRGLSNCSTKIHEITLTRAKEMGRTLCGWEN